MKRTISIILSVSALFAAMTGCQTQYTTYSGPEYIGFADSVFVCPVQSTGEAFGITIAATRASDRDRTFGVEVLGMKSSAVYGYHYRLASQTAVIPAGELTARIDIIGEYDRIALEDDLQITLRLVADESLLWDKCNPETRVEFRKVCPFDINNFTGYCLITSDFIYEYGISFFGDRLAKCEVADAESNLLRIKDFLYNGYDLLVRFDLDDPLRRRMYLDGEQMIADTRDAFYIPYGDGRLLGGDYNAAYNVFETCTRRAGLNLRIRVDEVGLVGIYPTIFEWLTDEEAESFM